MTGEMYSITQDGVDSDGNEWPIHAAIAKAIGGTLQPFDHYQGPYILIDSEVRVGKAPYAVPVPGAKRLWLTEEDDEAVVYREDTDTTASFWEGDTESGIAAAQSLL